MSRLSQKSKFDTTTESQSRTLGGGSPEIRLPGLTILYHPDLSRVGERALLTPLRRNQAVALSRLEPGFAAPGSKTEPVALEHRRLSRSPLLIEPEGQGVCLRLADFRTHVIVQGRRLADEHRCSEEDLARGIVLFLGGRVVLLLHTLDPLPTQDLPDLAMIGASPGMDLLRRSLLQVADMEVPVLLRGESGTGKELAAGALHHASRRREGPFIAVNMAAIPPTLAASELFGATRGAFTGAEQRRQGYFAQAEGGTLFLDEIGEISGEVQALLLRCLESGEIQPVGSDRPRQIDVRVVAATDADLEAAVAGESFRAPLFYRLGGFQIELPPLRDRREDIGLLLVAFLRRELEAVGRPENLHLDPPWLPASLVARLVAHPWPGNVRQLNNVVRQLVILNRDEPKRARADQALERLLQEGGPSPAPARGTIPRVVATSTATSTPFPQERKPADIAESELLAALRKARWRPHAAARALGIPRPSIYHLMHKSTKIRVATELEREHLAPALERFGGDLEAMAADP